jgi:hypothetical protein
MLNNNYIIKKGENENIGIKVHFENDDNIASSDSSLEAVVKYILHE